MRTYKAHLAGRHVHEAAVVPLERYRHRRGRAVPVLGDDQVRLARPRRLPLISVFAMQKYYYVRILLYTIMNVYPICDEIMSARNGSVINRLLSDALDGNHRVPE